MIKLKEKFEKLCHLKWVRTLVPALAGFLAYGGWGYFCNMSHGWEMGLQSGFVQGSFSFVVTIVFNGIMEWLYKLIKHRLTTTLLSAISLVSLSYTINWVAGTPEILSTIAPGAFLGSIYVYSYVKLLASRDKKTSS